MEKDKVPDYKSDQSLADVAHTFAEILSALEYGIRVHLSGQSDTTLSWESFYKKSWEPLYQQLALARLDPDFDREAAFDLIEFATREIDYMTVLFDNFLGGVQNAPKFSSKKPFYVHDVILDAVELFRFKAGNKGVDFQLDMHDDVRIRVDARSFRRALINILDNAVKYSYSGGLDRQRYIDIHTRYHQKEGELLLAVTSFGVGIREEEMTMVFERGYRSTLARDERRVGTGIGLSEAKSIIEANDGRIWLSSQHQHDDAFLTKVTIILPV